MQVIGFNFTKMSAEKLSEKISARPNTSIEFTDLQKDSLEILKESEMVRLSFKHEITYEDSEKKKETQARLSFEGNILLSLTSEESKEIFKFWKKKQLPANLNLSLFNLILKKCTPKAIMLEDEISLPFHTPMPKLSPK